MNSYKVIIIDQKNIMQALRGVLEHEGLVVSSSRPCDGMPASATIRELLRFDMLLPEECIASILQKIHTVPCRPYLVMAARVDNTDQLTWMEKGIRDAISKFMIPETTGDFHKDESDTESQSGPDRKLTAGPISIDSGNLRAFVSDTELFLTPTEFRLLEFLVSNPERVFSRGNLLAQLYGPGIEDRYRIVDCHIANIRRKISRLLSGRNVIRTVYGTGYAFRVSDEKCPPSPTPSGKKNKAARQCISHDCFQ